MNLTNIRRRVLEPLRSAGYTEREITLALEAIAAAAVEEAFAGDAAAIVADHLLAQQTAAARAAHGRATDGRRGPDDGGGRVVEIVRARGGA